MVSINDFANSIIELSGKNIGIKNIEGPTGVRGRNSDNQLIFEKLKWKPSDSLKNGIQKTYAWVSEQVANQNKAN